jgi:NAD(P)H-flavin reductase
LILEKPKRTWRGEKGLVIKLFDTKNVLEDASALVVGPPVMYGFVIPKLKEHGLRDQDIYLSFERRMYCGVGVCQHCAIGPYYTCKDGPVFRYDVIKSIKGAI